MVAQTVLPELVELRGAEESGPIEVEELIRDALAEHQDVISVDDALPRHCGLNDGVALAGEGVTRCATKLSVFDDEDPRARGAAFRMKISSFFRVLITLGARFGPARRYRA